MKYTQPAGRLLALLAVMTCAMTAMAQSGAYVTSAASLNAISSASPSDDAQAGALLTIRKRVD